MSPRLAAVRALQQVLGQGRSLNEALAGVLERVEARDRGLVQELTYGVLRQLRLLQALLDQLLSKPLRDKDDDVQLLLLVGLYQLLEMRTPAHAAVSASVEVTRELRKKWASGLANAVLRRAQREHESLRAQVPKAALQSHPGWLRRALAEAWPDDVEQLLERNNQHPPMTLRVNRRQLSREAYLEHLEQAGIAAEPGAVGADAVRLAQPMAVERLPGFAEGWVSVQDEAAQLAADLLDVPPGARVLDACAAPGGKTCHILERQPQLAGLVAVELDAARLQRIGDNLERLGLQAELVHGDAAQPESWWDGRPFDRILLDAPCSGTGVIRRHPDIKWLRRRQDIARLSELQDQLLRALWPLLAPGGKLVYATCSALPAENANRIRDFLARQGDAACEPLDAGWGRAQDCGRQILAGDQGMDGFYYACLGKR